MIEDPVLSKIEAVDEIIWGNYISHYDWSWENGKPFLLPKTFDVSSEVLYRDWVVARKLQELGIKRVLDVGSDTGHFMAVLKYHGIEAVGVEPVKSLCDKINEKGVNKCYPLGIQSLIKNKLEGYDCLVCMNIIQAPWKDEQLKKDFIEWIRQNFKYTVLTDSSHADRKWGFTKIHDFNFLRFYLGKFTYRVLQFLRMNNLVAYPCMQKLYLIPGKENRVN